MVDSIPNSDDSSIDIIQEAPSTPPRKASTREPSQPVSVLSHRFRESSTKTDRNKQERQTDSVDSERSSIAVEVRPPARPWEYAPFEGATTVDTVLEELKGDDGTLRYKIEFEDGNQRDVAFEDLLNFRNGQNALDLFENGNDQDEESSRRSSAEASMSRAKRTRKKPKYQGMVDTEAAGLDASDSEISDEDQAVKKRRLAKGRVSNFTSENSRQSSRLRGQKSVVDELDSDASSSEERLPPNPKTRTSGRTTRAPTIKPSKGRKRATGDDDELAGSMQIDESESSDVTGWIGTKAKKPSTKARRSRSKSLPDKRGRSRKAVEVSSSSDERAEPTRRSGRDRNIKSMRENDVDEEIYADYVEANNEPKIISIREIYQPVPKQSRFAKFHRKECEICHGEGVHSDKGTSQLIHCQGCSSSFHKTCIGYRAGREHMVTKVGHENFVLQCKRCIGLYSKKSITNPRMDVCTGCHEPGKACKAFSEKKTSKQEQKLREENAGDDPITTVDEDLINNADILLFRCIGCKRAWHFDHLPPMDDSEDPMDSDADVNHLRLERLKEYTPDWQCKECYDDLPKIQGFAAWRPVNRAGYKEEMDANDLREDEKEYLVKWTGKSHTKCTWMPGAWVWGVSQSVMRKAFYEHREGENMQPKWNEEEAIPEEYMRIEIVFDVRYDEDYEPRSLASDKSHISHVEEVLVKFQGLGYEETVWEAPPSPENTDRWSDFVSAYNEYLNGIYFKEQPKTVMNERIRDFRNMRFKELKSQPPSLTGGKIMDYQMDGTNWLLFNFHKQKNVILADEMGLGKTIQVISMIASLVKEKPKVWPFLIVTPNATCANWRREIKKWAPTLRVVAYYGSKEARDKAMEFELYPGGSPDLKAHVVITSYEPPIKQGAFFKKIKWAGLIVDEGQRLKNEDNLLYKALKVLKIPFQLLLTGTPLQNNKRELFNLLQFLDPEINAANMDKKYEELNNENLAELHDLIRPFFLRRTKLQVLKFLPPMAQVILPLSMSVVQKKLYKSILAKNSNLIRAILGQTVSNLNVKERGNLNNILMQLRKCLSHPFLYSSAIEERKVDDAALHRNLIDASSKFQLLEIMLPKLKQRGHRVLLFSQFLSQLDLVEDFLHGLDLPYQRLDGTIGSIEKQKRIDHFNAPESPDFAFLLSTRAGGVGINLATADTVIVMDPDFNPHQDIQAFSRAHRIGQKKKVLVFQLMTKDSAEEKIIQIGRKKMALDQALIESMDADEDAGIDVESILKHGAAALFNDDDRNDIRYDSASVDKLLDRTQIENTNTDTEKTAESQFSFARVWANDQDELVEDIEVTDDAPPDLSVWDKILKEREADAAAEAARNAQTFGRGKRQKHAVDYRRTPVEDDDDILLASSPPGSSHSSGPKSQKGKRRQKNSSDDDDFPGADSEKEESDVVSVNAEEVQVGDESRTQANHAHPSTIQANTHNGKPNKAAKASKPPNPQQRSAKERAPKVSKKASRQSAPNVPSPREYPPILPPGTAQGQHVGYENQYRPGINEASNFRPQGQIHAQGQQNRPAGGIVPNGYGNGPAEERREFCHACRGIHQTGRCPLKERGVELCGLCGIAHYAVTRRCPNLASEGEIRLMLDALLASTEPIEHIEAARKLLNRELAGRPKKQKA